MWENEEPDQARPPNGGEVADLLTTGLRRISEPRAALADTAVVHEVIPMAQCTESIRAAWNRIRKSSSCYRSPFFSYEFVNAVHQFAHTSNWLWLDMDSMFWHCCRLYVNGAWMPVPVGAGVNDAHGLLASDYPFSFVQFLNKCGLRSFAFHAAPPDSPDIERYEMGRGRSFLADLTVDPLGYEHYLRKTSSTIDRQGQKVVGWRAKLDHCDWNTIADDRI